MPRESNPNGGSSGSGTGGEPAARHRKVAVCARATAWLGPKRPVPA
jgi:hypothetical protein